MAAWGFLPTDSRPAAWPAGAAGIESGGGVGVAAGGTIVGWAVISDGDGTGATGLTGGGRGNTPAGGASVTPDCVSCTAPGVAVR